MQAVTIKWTHNPDGTYQVVGRVDSFKRLNTRFCARDEKHLRGMLLHDYLHVKLGIGFSIEEERQIKLTGSLTLQEIAKIEAAVKRLVSGKNIELKK